MDKKDLTGALGETAYSLKRQNGKLSEKPKTPETTKAAF